MKSHKKLKILLQVLGPIVFIYILFRVDYFIFARELKKVRVEFFALAFGLIVLEIMARSFRWRSILAALGILLSKANSIGLYWLGAFVGVVTPGRLGELIKVYFLKNKGYSAFRSFFSVILDRIADVLITFLFGALIALFYWPSLGIYVVVLGIIVLSATIFIFLLMNQRTIFHRLFMSLIKKILPVDFSQYSVFTLIKFWRGLKQIRVKNMISFTLYVCLGWLAYFFSRYAMALSLSLDLSFVDVAVVSVLVGIVGFLPISVAGLGTREASVIYLFALFGISQETALLFSLLIFATDMLALSFGLVPYLKESALISRAKRSSAS